MNEPAARTSSARILGCALVLGAGQVGCAASKPSEAAVATRPELPQAAPAPAPQEASKPGDQRILKLQARWASPQCGVVAVDLNRVPAIARLSSSAEGRVLAFGGKLLNVETGSVAEAPVDASYGFWAVPGTDYFATSTSWRTPPVALWNERGEVLYRCGAGGAAGNAPGGSLPLSQAELDAICKAGVDGASLPARPLSAELKAQAKGDAGAGFARQAEAVVLTKRDSQGTWLTVWQKGRGLVRLNKTAFDSWGSSAISDDAKTVAYAHGRNLYLYHLGAKPSEEEILLDRGVKSLLFTRGSQDVTVLQAGRVGKVVGGQVQPLFEFAEVPFQKPGRVDAGTLFVDLVPPTRIQLTTDTMLSSPVSTQPVSRGNVSPDGALVARASGQSVIVESAVAGGQQRKSLEIEVSDEDRSSYGSPSVDQVVWSPDSKRLMAVSRFNEVARAIVGRADEFDVESGDAVWSTEDLPEIVLPTLSGWVLTFEHEIRRIEGGKTVYKAEGEGAVTKDDLLVSLHEGTVSLVGSEGLQRQVELAEKRPGYIWQMDVEPQGRWLAYATQHGVAVVDLEHGSERLWIPGLLQATPSDPVLLGWMGSVVFMKREKDYLLFDARSQTQLVLGLANHSDAPPQFYALSPNGFVDGSPELVAQLSSEGNPLPTACQHPGLLREWLAEVNAP